MVRLPVWCALSASAFIAMSTPLYAASRDMWTPIEWVAPNLFGTVALEVAHTPYDAKWRHAIDRRGPIHPTARTALSALAMVQRDINHRVAYRADSPQLSAGDDWSTAANTVARGSGDCEDYAIAKAQSLLAMGFLPQDLYLVIGNDVTLRSAHAILVVRLGAKFYVLDNLASQVVDAEQFRNFSPIITLSANRKWVHGYEKGARERMANARPVGPALPTDRISAINIAQSAALTRPPTL